MTLPTTVVDWPVDVPARFTTRHGGVSTGPYAALNLGGHVQDDPEAVAENRRVLARDLGLPRERLRLMRQVHGADVVTVEGPLGDPEQDEPPEADGMVTTTPGLALGVLMADCVPVLLADAVAGVVGVAHAGRPGLLAGVVPATVARMRDLGARDLYAAVGPAVCGACYELPADLAERVAAAVSAARATTRWGTPAADVRAGVVAQLHHAGVRAVSVSDVCTRESPDHFSHRRDGPHTGRLAGVVWLPE
ncbi:MAG: peptidoglycan editing factor PgeF [Actinomycetes bacterium]